MFHETIWFLRGDTNIKYLEDNNAPIWRPDAFQDNLPGMQKEGIFPEGIVKYTPDWDKAMEEYGQRIKEDPEFAERWGDAGPIYGKQWRRWEYYDHDKKRFVEIDQLEKLINGLRKKPTGKKHIVDSWNPGDTPKMSLPPCHVLYQATANEEGELELQLYQRSCDQFLGVPFNIASYAALTQVIAQEAEMVPKTFIHTFGDSHFYAGIGKRTQWHRDNFKELQKRIRNVSVREEYLEVVDWINKNAPSDGNEEKYDHVTAILEQMSREPKPLPKLHITKKPFDQLTIDDFVVEDYNPHPPIRRSMAV
jgi:thymidylate synthase